MMRELRSLRGSEQGATGRREGIGMIGALIFAGIMAVAAVLGPILTARGFR
jgi:hypothetical protein